MGCRGLFSVGIVDLGTISMGPVESKSEISLCMSVSSECNLDQGAIPKSGEYLCELLKRQVDEELKNEYLY
jgi:hypothetical protein